MRPSIDSKMQEYTAMMLEHTSVGIAVFAAQDLCLKSANSLYLRSLHSFFGDQDNCQQYIGQSIFDWAKRFDASDAANALSIFHKVAATGIPYRTEEIEFCSPVRGTTYWNWILDPVCDQDEHVTHIIHTLSEVTELVAARQYAEEAQISLSQVNQTITEERERLKVITAIVSSIRESLDTQHIAEIVIETLRKHLTAMSACLYIADPQQNVFRQLYTYELERFRETLKILAYLPFERLTFVKDILHKRESIVIEDLQVAAEKGLVDKNEILRHIGTRGYICVPLWYGDHLEGMYVLLFAHAIKADGPEVKLLEGCSMHIASAIAHGRLHTTLERERARMSTILDHIPDGILIVEATTGNISYANPSAAQSLGIALDNIVNSPIHDYGTRSSFINIIDGKPVLPWNFFVVRALCGEVLMSKETLVTRPDGSRAFMLASSAPLCIDKDIMSGTVIVFQDITIQKTLDQHKSEFLSIANHELRTPITIIQGFAELLQLKAPQALTAEKTPDTLAQYALSSIVDQSQHLTRLIEEMLNISRIEQAQFTLRCENSDVLELVRSVFERQSMTNRHRQLLLMLDGVQADDALSAYIDRERIAQALNNLVSNAVKYSNAPGKIEIGLRHHQNKSHELLIWVKDEGIGIPLEDIPLIFERFHRGKNIDRSSSGFGIGLYLVKEIISRHYGKVWVESGGGNGSTFYITLPLKPPAGISEDLEP